jgi:hypothetical protein
MVAGLVVPLSSTTAIVAAIACAASASAAEIEDVFGRWGGNGSAYDCNGEPGTEVAPVKVERDERGLHAGAYAWNCTVEAPEKRGVLFGGPSTCGFEGDGEIEQGYMQLGLTAEGQLLIADQWNIVLLDKCPVRQ